MLPLMLWRLALPVELARRERVFCLGEALGGALVDTGEGEDSVKLVLRGNRSIPVRSNLGKERWFSLSTVEAGDAERGESRKDIDTVRLLEIRKVLEISRDGVEG
tara:strand:- start:5595 stop:5909 length:315 start_codon:yes stop_codon:yes gene_type:complete